MNTHSSDDTADAEGKGFQFPGRLEVTVMGDADADLAALLAAEMQAAGVVPVPCDPREKLSSGGRFRSVTAGFECASREHLEALHRALKAHPSVKWTL
jgi:putative lipoic acid-binding regulatory protein